MTVYKVIAYHKQTVLAPDNETRYEDFREEPAWNKLFSTRAKAEEYLKQNPDTSWIQRCIREVKLDD